MKLLSKDDEEEARVIPENYVKIENFYVALADSLINTEVLLHLGKEGDGSDGPLIKARVLRYLTDENGNLVGIPNEDIKFDTTLYEVEFPDGQQEPYDVNIIVQ